MLYLSRLVGRPYQYILVPMGLAFLNVKAVHENELAVVTVREFRRHLTYQVGRNPTFDHQNVVVKRLVMDKSELTLSCAVIVTTATTARINSRPLNDSPHRSFEEAVPNP
jgi:hypothetical protein